MAKRKDPASRATRRRPLEGVNVLDASRVLAGPYAAMLLGDLGAEVVKVERPGTGDQTRAWGPPFQGGESSYYLSTNRNKRSLSLNLKTAEGRAIFRRLVLKSDVVIENFRPRTLQELGLDYQELAAVHPPLIWCKITGYGAEGAWKDRPAYDIALQAESGLMSITGEKEGPPVRVGVAVIDLLTAHYAVQAVLAALWQRRQDGRGQNIDLAMLDCGAAFLSYMAQHYFATGEPPRSMGSRHPTIVPYQAFSTADGYVVVAVGSQEIWRRFCEAVGRRELSDDPRFSENSRRVQNRFELEAILTGVLAGRSTQDWLEAFRKWEVPASPVNDLCQVWELPSLRERGLLAALPHPAVGELQTVDSPLKWPGTGSTLRRHPPLLGEHNAEILGELGYSPEEISQLAARGVI